MTAFFGWEPLADQEQQEALDKILMSWERTPYRLGQCMKGNGVDCVRFVCAVLGEMTGKHIKVAAVPSDAQWHSPETAHAAEKVIRDFYAPTQEVDVTKECIRPGDVIITGPRGGGPGHSMMVGCKQGQLWHSSQPRVMQTGLRQVFLSDRKIFYCYRVLGWKL